MEMGDDKDMDMEEGTRRDRDGITIGTRRPLTLLKKSFSPSDDFFTDSLDEQADVETGIFAMYQAYEKGGPRCTICPGPLLLREKHSSFLRRGLKTLSCAYEALDASRPWLCYWILHSMNLLDQKLSREEAIRISQFLEKCQNHDTGGFGGGPDQFSHLAATYAAINALVSLGIPEALSVVDKPALLRFLKSMKLKNGSFRMHRGGEIDVRAAYCAVVVADITNLYSEDLFCGTAKWIAKCQTYEGGFGGFIGGEAHGGYTFCAVAALALLKSTNLMESDSLLHWLSYRQLSVEGGFQGRTNKLVDGCYSFWQGACFCLLGENYTSNDSKEGPHWLFNQLALQEYILMCCQHPVGGLIDKPGKQRDYYHTCYTLSGLSIAQHSPGSTKTFLENEENELKEVHPVYNLTLESFNLARKFFYQESSKSSSK